MLFNYGAYFGVYTSTIAHATLYHRHEIVSGFKDLIGRKSAIVNSKDIHTRLMKSYEEVPEWVYLIVLCVSIGIAAASIAAYPTNASPTAALYGVLLAAIFCITRRHLLYSMRYHQGCHQHRSNPQRHCRVVRWSLVPR